MFITPPQFRRDDDGMPTLAFYKKDVFDEDGWFALSKHACGGYRANYLNGYIRPLVPSADGLKLISRIADEEFCSICVAKSLDHEVNAQHINAYKTFLLFQGLTAGDCSCLQQAVYPLAATDNNLQLLGINDIPLPPGATLLVLGWNCD